MLSYEVARRILNDPDHFPADPRVWEQGIDDSCPVLAMMRWRPNALRNSGPEHLRYRAPSSTAISEVNLFELQTTVEQTAISLINGFCGNGKADLLEQYVWPLVFTALNAMLGVEPDIGQQVAAGMAAMFDAGAEAGAGERQLVDALRTQTEQKRREPHDDVTSRLIYHANGLTDEEVVHQLVTFYGAGIEPLVHLISNTLRTMLTDQGFGDGVFGGSLPTRDALDGVLFTDPPLANFCVTYPRQPIVIEDFWLPAHQPVVISMAACNNDPNVKSPHGHDGNRSHLAYGAGPHTCPAQDPARLIAQNAIDQLLDALPEIRLAVPEAALAWRPGPFHRALTTLPVEFPASSPLPAPAQRT
ncbi:cytochrome P450 (plasmid) [Nocardia sp. NBC_01377]|uniref:cytochrome P450 n=1 Tax=Nocardia sp. NBC_01377 TaxID=2903595 RepID=UPI0032437BCA